MGTTTDLPSGVHTGRPMVSHPAYSCRICPSATLIALSTNLFPSARGIVEATIVLPPADQAPGHAVDQGKIHRKMGKEPGVASIRIRNSNLDLTAIFCHTAHEGELF